MYQERKVLVVDDRKAGNAVAKMVSYAGCNINMEGVEAMSKIIEDVSVMEVETYRRSEPKIGRNERCPCGSGRKYKKCCLK